MAKAKTKTSSSAAKPVPKTRVRKLSRSSKKKVARIAHRPPGSFRLLGIALRHLWRHKRLFGLILLIYVLLYAVFVKGLAFEFQIEDLKEEITTELSGEVSAPETATALFGGLLGTAGMVSDQAGSVYQLVLFVVFSLVMIWTLRQTFDTKNNPKLRQAFYQSSYPLVPYLLVGLVILLQMIPGLLSVSVYSLAVQNGIVVSGFEQIIWAFIAMAGVIVSIYFVSSSVFASYIVTLPDMTPLKALRSAKRLVRFQRWSIIRKVVFLPLAVFVFLAAVFLPLAFFAPIAAEILFMVISLAIIMLVHTYFYALYREML